MSVSERSSPHFQETGCLGFLLRRAGPVQTDTWMKPQKLQGPRQEAENEQMGRLKL